MSSVANTVAKSSLLPEATALPLPDGIATDRLLDQIAGSGAPLLIVGEPGTGKRTTAMALHQRSERRQRAFVTFEAKSVSVEDFERAYATAGTVYISEIYRVSEEMQADLLEKLRNPGSDDARIICSTDRKMLDAAGKTTVREDFLLTIGGLTLQMLPLRHRKSEMLNVAERYLAEAARQFGKPQPLLSEEMKAFLLEHDWPGNFNELETAMKACVALSNQSIVLAALRASSEQVATGMENGTHRPSLKEASRAASMKAEKELISEVLVATGWNRKRAARELRISYKALLYKLKQTGMDHPRPVRHDGEAS